MNDFCLLHDIFPTSHDICTPIMWRGIDKDTAKIPSISTDTVRFVMMKNDVQ